MAKSPYARAVDSIQAALRPRLKELGFRVRGRSFNGVTEDGLTQVVNFQMGPADPPAMSYIPGLREKLHGLFTVNLGVHVPEVMKYHGGGAVSSWVQESHCCIRDRLLEPDGKAREIWWRARLDEVVVDHVWRCLESSGLSFLERFSTRDKILSEYQDRSNTSAGSPPLIARAIILAERGEGALARTLLAQQADETTIPGHRVSVSKLAERLGLGSLDG